MSIIVFGSINMDLVVRVPRLPAPGETLRGSDFFTAPGGKGANQAAACARLSAPVAMIGRVGDDVFGTALLDGLKTLGVDVSRVTVTPGPSGVAVIAVDEHAENSIIIIPSANGQVGMEDLVRLDAALPGTDSLLLQLEIPLEAVTAAARLAHARGVRVILDPAPAAQLNDELYTLTDIITPNETECAALVGFPVHNPTQAERAAEILLNRGVKHVIIKMGERGAYLHDGSAEEMIPSFHVEAIDTTAAGDAFNGALAVALDKGHTLREAVCFANAAGALSATKHGAQPSMPTLEEVENLNTGKFNEPG
jgi:ribokinase